MRLFELEAISETRPTVTTANRRWRVMGQQRASVGSLPAPNGYPYPSPNTQPKEKRNGNLKERRKERDPPDKDANEKMARKNFT